ncbi:MAG: flagellar biosynthesis protein FlhF [Defluviitaleaceae bacterium]|nr:flagellar biosynthesis protein FlhF [Defluviitaleaceae bacterium]
MKIKKVVAKTEREAVDKIKEICGPSALILDIKKQPDTGFLWFKKKGGYIVTAAYEVDESKNVADDLFEARLQAEEEIKEEIKKDIIKEEIKKAIKEEIKKEIKEETTTDDEIEVERKVERETEREKETEIAETPKEAERKDEADQVVANGSEAKEAQDSAAEHQRIQYLESMLEGMSRRLSASEFKENTYRIFENRIIQNFYEALINQGVLDNIAREVLSRVINSVESEKTLNISFVAAQVYNTILSTIKEPSPIIRQDDAMFVFFVGPTGVGKTTTIAKLASRLVLEQNVKVGLITADTYRIAAVEQLKVYAEILNLDIGVVYEKGDFINIAGQMRLTKDIVFVDTAGRSHKNKGNLLDLKELIDESPDNSEKYLVLSMTTKYEDLVNIISTYSDIGIFRLILTKFDETTSYGSIFNLCYTMGLEVVYITTGQNVPDDIELLRPEKIAKALLGLETGL